MAPIFGPRSTTLIHAAEAVFLISVLAVSGARIGLNGGIKSRADSMSLAMAAKSVVFLAYQILSQHTHVFRRWASLKAYVIINGMEIVFWAAVAFLTIQAAIQKCVAPTCLLAWGIVALSLNMSVLMAYATVVTYNNFKAARKADPVPMVLESIDSAPRQNMSYATNTVAINKTVA